MRECPTGDPVKMSATLTEPSCWGLYTVRARTVCTNCAISISAPGFDSPTDQMHDPMYSNHQRSQICLCIRHTTVPDPENLSAQAEKPPFEVSSSRSILHTPHKRGSSWRTLLQPGECKVYGLQQKIPRRTSLQSGTIHGHCSLADAAALFLHQALQNMAGAPLRILTAFQIPEVTLSKKLQVRTCNRLAGVVCSCSSASGSCHIIQP